MYLPLGFDAFLNMVGVCGGLDIVLAPSKTSLVVFLHQIS